VAAKRENRPARVVSRCRWFTSRTHPTRPSRFCRTEENTFPPGFKIFESTKRACHHDYVFISEIRIYFVYSVGRSCTWLDILNAPFLFTFFSFPFFFFTRRTRLIGRWKYRHEGSVTNLLAKIRLYSPLGIVHVSLLTMLTFAGFGTAPIANLTWFCARISKREGKKELFVDAFIRFVSIQYSQLDCLVKTGKNTI